VSVGAIDTGLVRWGGAFWRLRAAQGFVIGAAIAILEFLYYLPFVSPNGLGLHAFVSSFVVWSGECALFAALLGIAERFAATDEVRTRRLAIALVSGVAVSVIVWHGFTRLVLHDALGMHPFSDYVGQPIPWTGAALYHAWLMLFFGGLIAAVYASQRRRARMLAMLRAAELGRATAQQRLAEAKLASLQARVDPEYLYQMLSRLERLYDEDPPAADRLLDELITFLRNALVDARAPKLEEVR
jgi:hypothetical protein